MLRTVTAANFRPSCCPQLFAARRFALASVAPGAFVGQPLQHHHKLQQQQKQQQQANVKKSQLDWKTDAAAEQKRQARAAFKRQREAMLEFNRKLAAGEFASDVVNKPEATAAAGSSSSSTSSSSNPLTNMILERVLDSTLPPIRLTDIFAIVTTPWKMLDEYNVGSRTRRLQRVSTIFRFLFDHNVILHSVVRFHPTTKTWNATPSYPRLVTLGQSKIISEVSLRATKVFPNATLQQLQCLERCILDPRYLASLFDAAHLNRIIHPRSARQLYPLTASQKATLMCAIIGELGWFVARTKATDRTHNNALFPPSDALILHVLSAHAVESVMGDLLWHLLEPSCLRVMGSWRNLNCSVPDQLLEGLAVENGNSNGNSILKQLEPRARRWETSKLEETKRQMTEGEKKRRDETLVKFNEHGASLVAAAAAIDKEMVNAGFYSPTPLKLKWEKLERQQQQTQVDANEDDAVATMVKPPSITSEKQPQQKSNPLSLELKRKLA